MNDHTLKIAVDAIMGNVSQAQHLKLLKRIVIYDPDNKRTFNQLEWIVDDEK